MIQEQLVDYISSQMKLGVSQDAIKTTLVGAGWAMADVDDTFKKINGGGATSASVAKPAAMASPVTTSFSASPASASASSMGTVVKTPAKSAEPQTIRVSDLVSASSSSAVSAVAPMSQPKISPLSQGAMGSVKSNAPVQAAATKPQKAKGGSAMTIVWIVLVIVFAGLSGYFFFENMGLSSQVGTVNTQSQSVSSQISSLETQVKALTASSTSMMSELASLGASNQTLETELSFFVAPATGATTTNFALNGIISGGKPTFLLTTADGVRASIKNSADASVRAGLQPFASSSATVQITGTYVPGSSMITALTANGVSLYPSAPTSTATTTPAATTTASSTTGIVPLPPTTASSTK